MRNKLRVIQGGKKEKEVHFFPNTEINKSLDEINDFLARQTAILDEEDEVLLHKLTLEVYREMNLRYEAWSQRKLEAELAVLDEVAKGGDLFKLLKALSSDAANRVTSFIKKG